MINNLITAPLHCNSYCNLKGDDSERVKEPCHKPDHEGEVEWWGITRRTPYYEYIFYTSICAILRTKMNEKIFGQGNRLTLLGKSLIDLR